MRDHTRAMEVMDPGLRQRQHLRQGDKGWRLRYLLPRNSAAMLHAALSDSRSPRACGTPNAPTASRSAACVSGWSAGNGSMLKTSSPACRIWPDSSASIIAASSTKAPRAVLTRIDARSSSRRCAARDRKPRVSSFSSRCSETTWLSRQQILEVGEVDAGMILRRPVPGDHSHAAAERDARHFGGDAAKSDQPKRFACQLHAVLARPVPARISRSIRRCRARPPTSAR